MKRAIGLAVLAVLALTIGARVVHAQTQVGVIDQSLGTNVALAAAPPIAPLSGTLNAQATSCTPGTNGHCVLLSWTPSTTPGTQVNIFRGTTAGGESTTPINAAPVPSGTTSYNDGTVVGLTTYYYVAQAVCVPGSTPACPAGSNPTSVKSNEVSAVVPGTVVPPPTLNTPTVIASVLSDGNVLVVASWTDAPGVTDHYILWGGNAQLDQGPVRSSTGQYSTAWSGSAAPDWFTVCNSTGQCVAKAITVQ